MQAESWAATAQIEIFSFPADFYLAD